MEYSTTLQVQHNWLYKMLIVLIVYGSSSNTVLLYRLAQSSLSKSIGRVLCNCIELELMLLSICRYSTVIGPGTVHQWLLHLGQFRVKL